MEKCSGGNAVACPAAAGRETEYVMAQFAHLIRPPGRFELENGEYLPELTIAYETYGTLNSAADNAILVCHGYTASEHAAGEHHPGSYAPGWWDGLIGPGKAFDTNRYFVVCSNVLGGCKGTTGPSSTDPRSGRPYASLFPNITLGDTISAQKLLLDHLGVTKLLSVVGASMGGMQTLGWGLCFPESTASVIPIACAPRLSVQALALNAAGRQAVEADGDYNHGEYYGKKLPVRGLAAARIIGHVTYLSAEFLETKRIASGQSGSSQALDYFQEECDRFVTRFDANSYIVLSRAMEQYDVTSFLETHYLSQVPSKPMWLLMSLSSDWLFPQPQLEVVNKALLQAGHNCQHITISTMEGHDAFLTEQHKFAKDISAFLDTLANQTA
jgi:homoserine O-acetyltransferase